MANGHTYRAESLSITMLSLTSLVLFLCQLTIHSSKGCKTQSDLQNYLGDFGKQFQNATLDLELDEIGQNASDSLDNLENEAGNTLNTLRNNGETELNSFMNDAEEKWKFFMNNADEKLNSVNEQTDSTISAIDIWLRDQ